MTDWTVGIISPQGYPHSEGFADLALALQGGLHDLGFSADVIRVSGDDAVFGERPIILGANLLPRYPMTIPKDAILFNLEVHNTGWTTTPYLNLLHQYEVWDYSAVNAQWLTEQGLNVRVCGIGYHPCLERIERNRYEMVGATLCEMKPIEQDIDVLFYGSMTPRRSSIIQRLTAAGIKVRYLFDIYGEERDAYIARSKIVLNLHAYEHSPLEMVRLQFLWANRVYTMVETPFMEADNPLGAAVACTSIERIVEDVQWSLANADSRQFSADLCHEMFRQHPQSTYIAQAAYLTRALQLVDLDHDAGPIGRTPITPAD